MGERAGRERWGAQGRFQVEFDHYTFSRRAAERETQTHTMTLIPACKPVPRPCRAPGPGQREWKEEERGGQGGSGETHR